MFMSVVFCRCMELRCHTVHAGLW